jgi:hypothetical protein
MMPRRPLFLALDRSVRPSDALSLIDSQHGGQTDNRQMDGNHADVFIFSNMKNDTTMEKHGVECIELDDSDSSVEAHVPPTRKPPASKASDLDESDSDDSLLLSGGPIFSKTSTTSTTFRRQPSSSQEVQRSRQGVSQNLTKQHQREEARRKEKERREEQKRQEKRAREEERNRKRAEEEVAKRLEQEAKRRRIESAQQTSGKFAPNEIAILMDPQLMERMETDRLQETYVVHPHSNVRGSVRWIRKDYTAGGAQAAIQALQAQRSSGYQFLDRMVICFHEPKEFINMLQRSDHDDDYPLLESWLRSLEFRGKLVLLLHQVTDALHREWNAHRRTKQNPPPPTDAELDDSIVWLLIQFQVECIKCDSEEQVLQTIKKMTRALSEEPYKQQVTELECVKKIKSDCPDNADNFTKAKDCWIRQLQQVPRVSEAMARHLSEYFPTARSLWDAYQDPSRTQDEKRLLIAPLFKVGRQHPKLADTVYRLLTSADPNEFL